MTPLSAARRTGRHAGRLRCGRARVVGHAHVSQLRLLLPPGVGPGAAQRLAAVVRGLRRADAAPALHRGGGRAGPRVRGERGPRARAAVLSRARGARARDLPPGGGGVRALERRAGGAVRRRERLVPALRRARLRGPTVPRARRLGGRAGRRGPSRCARPARPRRAPPSRSLGAHGPVGAAGDRRLVAGEAEPPGETSQRREAAGRSSPFHRAGHLVTHGPDRHRQPDPLDPVHERARRGSRARARDPARAGVVRHVHRLHRAPAGRAARTDRRVPRVAVPRLAAAAGPGRAAGRRHRHLRRHGGARPLDPPALPDGAGDRHVPVRGLRAAGLHGGRGPRARDLAARERRCGGGRRDRDADPRAVAHERHRGDAVHPRHPRQPRHGARRPRGACGNALRHAHLPDLPARPGRQVASRAREHRRAIGPPARPGRRGLSR